jgi:hypothetical protein
MSDTPIKHTPVTWLAKKDCWLKGYGRPPAVWGIYARKMRFATFHGPSPAFSQDELDSYAHLTAAAPDLLAACRDMASFILKSQEPDGRSSASPGCPGFFAYQTGCQAIAKATATP